jgi:hypothetical protein
MQRSLTPKQTREFESLGIASKRAEEALLEAEQAFGKVSADYAVAERQRDEILAKMNRITGDLDDARIDYRPAPRRVVTVVVRSKRSIRR